MMLFNLFLSFFKMGLFAAGGGLATLPFLYELSEKSSWFSMEDIVNMVAVSEATPGPLGVNMATYVGYLNSGVFGSIIAPLGEIAPSIIIITVIAMFLKKFKDNQIVKNVFYGLRAASCALVINAAIEVCKVAFFGESFKDFFLEGAILAVVLLVMSRKLKWHPIIYIAISALVGIIFKFQL